MSLTLRKIDFSWSIESVVEPFFSYSNAGLHVCFMVFLGMDERCVDISDYLSGNMLADESDMPDETFNNAGYRIAGFDFKCFDFFCCTDKISGLKKYLNYSELHPGVYEEIGESNDMLGYVFIGNDLMLSVKSNGYIYSLEGCL